MLKTQVISPVVRAVLVIGAVAALVTGVTYAALQSQATLSEMTISGGGALRVNNDPDDSDNASDFNLNEDGFAFTNIVPGVAASQEFDFQVRNISTTTVGVNAQIVPSATLPAGITGADITFTFDPVDPDEAPFDLTWADLVAADGAPFASSLLGDGLNSDPVDGVGETRTYTVKVSVAGSVGSSSFTIPDFTLAFGVPEATPTP